MPHLKCLSPLWQRQARQHKRNVLGAKKTNKHKTHKHFSDGPRGTTVPGTNPHPSQGQTGQNGDFTVELNRERPVCPRDGSHFVPGRGPICPGDGSCLSQTPSRRKCLCLLGFSCPNVDDLGVQKLTRSGLNGVFLKDKFALFEASKKSVKCQNNP